MSTTGWEPSIGDHPYPPANVQVISPLFSGALDVRWDDPSLLNTGGCPGKSNTQWNIVGINVYRSDSGERGPYRRLNIIPIGSTFYRDMTNNVLVENEVVDWGSAWVSKGDTANDRRWTFKTRRSPVVKRSGQAIAADSPSDVALKIDGVAIPVERVFGTTGEITLINVPVYDVARQRIDEPTLPDINGTSAVSITYYINQNVVKTDLDQRSRIFYRLTTVAIDASTPSGLTETPLEYSPPVSITQVETPDYIWREAVRRNRWILEQGGERVKLYVKRSVGVPCTCRIDEQTSELLQQHDQRCADCYGVGVIGGYDGPIDIILAPDDAERRVSQGVNGRRLEHTYEVWTGPSPVLTQRDFIIKQTGERYSIGPVRRPAARGLPLQQHFNIQYIDEQDIRYQVPVSGIESLAWPETRYTNPEASPCEDAAPYPVGFDYQATPMETDKNSIPAERQQRGRTPTWGNISS